MSNFYPPAPPKKLVRSTSNRIIGGVCAGVADYLNMDANLVRVLTVLISLFTGVPIVVYIVLAFVLPEEGSEPSPSYPPVRGAEPQSAAGSWTQPTYPPQASPFPQTQPAAEPVTDPVWGPTGAPWEQRTGQRNFEPEAERESAGAAAGTAQAGQQASGDPEAGAAAETEATVPIDAGTSRPSATGENQGTQPPAVQDQGKQA